MMIRFYIYAISPEILFRISNKSQSRNIRTCRIQALLTPRGFCQMNQGCWERHHTSLFSPFWLVMGSGVEYQYVANRVIQPQIRHQSGHRLEFKAKRMTSDIVRQSITYRRHKSGAGFCVRHLKEWAGVLVQGLDKQFSVLYRE
jgi:hypothetical protein